MDNFLDHMILVFGGLTVIGLIFIIWVGGCELILKHFPNLEKKFYNFITGANEDKEEK